MTSREQILRTGEWALPTVSPCVVVVVGHLRVGWIRAVTSEAMGRQVGAAFGSDQDDWAPGAQQRDARRKVKACIGRFPVELPVRFSITCPGESRHDHLLGDSALQQNEDRRSTCGRAARGA